LQLTTLTEIVASPGALAVTFPVEETVASLVLPEAHTKVLSATFEGSTVVVSSFRRLLNILYHLVNIY